MLEIDFDTSVDLHAIVFHLHGTILGTLVVTQGLIKQVGGIGKYGELILFAKSVAGIEVEIVYAVVVAVEGCHGTKLIDEARSGIPTQAQVYTLVLEVQRSVGGVLRATRHLDIFGVVKRAMLKLMVARAAVGIGISTVETNALQRRSDETEVALVSHLNAKESCVVGVDGLGNLVFGCLAVGVEQSCGDIGSSVDFHTSATITSFRRL